MTALVDTPGRTWRRGLLCGRQLTVMMAYVGGLWFLPIVVVVFVGIGALQVATGGWGDLSWSSVWEHSLQPMRYFPLAMAIIVGAGMLPNYVSHGMTRREFSIGVGIMIAVVSVAFAVVGAIGLGVEDVIYGWFGESPEYTVPHLYADPGDVPLVLAQYALLTSAHMATGWLIGATYYRFGGYLGTAMLLVTLLPAIAVEFVLSVSYFGQVAQDGFGWDRPPLAVVIPACLAITAATCYGTYRFVRRLAIKP
ncbi:hypothetical protein G1H11_23930 [Phytoactinopolyspora alkaliphila]|uniref:Uncharacterized protein n=1 Tax=Phytoactinopolyspora alkaliphila TaxID=1783498 RepID=A0A6N9YTQ9_9ACTN|nr:hypothetical protein [Phytoactinopolyspora alkaliphila]NED98355.1 hypothetical protein [Phytoactinopolyspora alkaliphila]